MASPFPLECLQGIAQVLVNDYELQTLANLLRVNRFFCEATIPLLYRDPTGLLKTFRTLHFSYDDLPLMSDLFKTLLLQRVHRSTDSLEPSRLLSIAYNLTTDSSGEGEDCYSVKNRSSLDYLSHLRVFDCEAEIFRLAGSGIELASLGSAHPELVAFLATEEFRDQCEWSLIPGAHRDDPVIIDQFVRQFAATLLRRQLTWALCGPVLEQIQKINIPLSDIQRFLAAVDRFQSLAHVVFIMDEPVTYYHVSHQHQDSETVSEELYQDLRNRGQQAVEAMFEFVERHVRTFGRQLKNVDCPMSCSNWWWTGTYRPCPADVLFRLHHTLAPQERPRHIGIHWDDAVSQAETFDWSIIESISIIANPRAWMPKLKRCKPILPQCRSLTSLATISWGRDMFQWAVQEKKNRNRAGEPPLTLVPLSEVTLSCNGDEPLGEELDDLLVAFSDTLESLRISTHRIGYGWQLSVLKNIEIESNKEPILVHPEFLAHNPTLKSVYICDYSEAYRSSHGMGLPLPPSHGQHAPLPWRPAFLPDLTSLTLVGLPAVLFHPKTLDSTPNLEQLELTTVEVPGQVGSGDIEVTNGANVGSMGRYGIVQNPQWSSWSWCWHLPMLHCLRLLGDFAHQFQFRMLQGCPSLRELYLDTRIRFHPGHTRVPFNPDGPRRIVTKVELYCARASSSASTLALSDPRVHVQGEGDQGAGTPELTVLPNLETFHLCGPWVVDEEVSSILVLDMFPRLQKLKIFCEGLEPQEWMTILMRMPELHEAETDWDWEDTDVLDLNSLGLIPIEDEHAVFGQELYKMSPIMFFLRERQYVYRAGRAAKVTE